MDLLGAVVFPWAIADVALSGARDRCGGLIARRVAYFDVLAAQPLATASRLNRYAISGNPTPVARVHVGVERREHPERFVNLARRQFRHHRLCNADNCR